MNALHCSRCTLEPLVEAHAPEMFHVLSDPAIYEFENEPPLSAEWLAHRYKLLESRVSTDGSETWLNWVVRLQTGELAGYVQATVLSSRSAYVAYELSSQHWRQGIGSSAVSAALSDLQSEYKVREFLAVLKAKNFRSLGLLLSLGFTAAANERALAHNHEPDELLMFKVASRAQNAA